MWRQWGGLKPAYIVLDDSFHAKFQEGDIMVKVTCIEVQMHPDRLD